LLSTEPKLPDTREIVQSDGFVNLDLVAALHQWATPAMKMMKKYKQTGGDSLAIPTWHYGHEPSSPLATHVAKYFLNSIREDVLLALASGGVVFSPGRAGTLQEVFQAAAQNYYGRAFAPMVFWDERFWTQELPVRPLLEGLFVRLHGMPKDEFDAKILITSDVDEAVAFLQKRPVGFDRLLRANAPCAAARDADDMPAVPICGGESGPPWAAFSELPPAAPW
jgi:hypothetical protein